ncbi:glycine-rich RNA-binding protein 2, mitochondrial [Morus notabilis]|uniref:glycine-rich RNA-binding protein 2, mitochondrial n=1 Tax=Morus notabilis TaxID=981085 RepID=UPI000CED5C92|nr:glycine-rich RNA-binding protein 2, mitochondrial [Morus notabilis]
MRGSPSGVCLWRTFPLARFLWARPFYAKLFVGGLLPNSQLFNNHAILRLYLECQSLSYDTNETVLKDAFEQHGDIIEVKVICDHKSGRSKGYGFVQFTSETAANTALKQMDGQLLDGRNIRVHFAHK